MVQEYTKAQIKEHNSKSSVWILIENDVYDVTPFLNEVIVFLISLVVGRRSFELNLH